MSAEEMDPRDRAALVFDARSHLRRGLGCRSCIDGIERLNAEVDRLTAALAEAERNAYAVRGKVDRCVDHLRLAMDMLPEEPDAGIEAMVAAWVKYHGDACRFKERAEKAEAALAGVRSRVGALADEWERDPAVRLDSSWIADLRAALDGA